MRTLQLLQSAVVSLALALASGNATSQETDTFSISGTFRPGEATPGLGADLAAVVDPHAWVLTLSGVTVSYQHHFDVPLDFYGNPTGETDDAYITRVNATSFDLEFFGPDAGVLNDVVSSQLTQGGQYIGVVLELRHGTYYEPWYETTTQYNVWWMGLSPPDRNAGVLIDWEGQWSPGLFDGDPGGFPVLDPQRLYVYRTVITDRRPGNGGLLLTREFSDFVDIGSSVPPDLPPPPPPPPTLSIADGSVREGNKGTTRLDLTVTLSQSAGDTVTVKYATANGTALAKSDYTATSGTLTFAPGVTSRTISIAIKGDRKREPDETFFVQLSNAVGATIADGIATADILNDD
jgi:hypothetical protein